MLLLNEFKRLFAKSVWTGAGLFVAGLFLLRLSDSSAIYKLIRLLLPGLNSNFVEAVLSLTGIASIFAAFAAFAVWATAARKKQLAKRKTAWQQAAREMNWTYSEFPSAELRAHIIAFKECRALGALRTARATKNIRSATF